jgi:NADP-dependent 3-hydroxy acid dehydrogenase YdfG
MRTPPRSLVGAVAVVTGGARGIGRAIAEALSVSGMKVAIGDLDVELAERAARDIGGDSIGLGLDVTVRASFERAIDTVEERCGPLDVLVNNAGIMPVGPFLDEDDRTTRRIIDVNVHGVLHGMKIVLPRFVARGQGHVVNLASMAAKVAAPGGVTYSGSKHFVLGASDAIRQELRGTGVEVTCVMPGPVQTEMMAGLRPARGLRQVTVEEVATAIVAVLRRPRFEVHVPAVAGRMHALSLVLPRRARELLLRAFRADRVLTQIDHAARRAYEERVR